MEIVQMIIALDAAHKIAAPICSLILLFVCFVFHLLADHASSKEMDAPSAGAVGWVWVLLEVVTMTAFILSAVLYLLMYYASCQPLGLHAD